MSQVVIGTQFTEESATAKFAVGTRATDSANGKEYIYVRADAGGVTGAGYVVLIDESYAADMIDTTNSGTGFGQMVGVAPLAVTASYYFWAQIGGVANVRVAASAAANVALNTTATAGQLDDDGTSGSEDIDGLVLTTANGGAAGTAAGILNNPLVGATNA